MGSYWLVDLQIRFEVAEYTVIQYRIQKVELDRFSVRFCFDRFYDSWFHRVCNLMGAQRLIRTKDKKVQNKFIIRLHFSINFF